jgi:hypothetical protein
MRTKFRTTVLKVIKLRMETRLKSQASVSLKWRLVQSGVHQIAIQTIQFILLVALYFLCILIC